MSSLVGPTNDLDHTPFRSLRPRSQIGSSAGGSPKTQGPVVCSVAPNLPVRPPSSSDNDSIRKNHWDLDYEGECWFELGGWEMKHSMRQAATFMSSSKMKDVLSSSNQLLSLTTLMSCSYGSTLATQHEPKSGVSPEINSINNHKKEH